VGRWSTCASVGAVFSEAVFIEGILTALIARMEKKTGPRTYRP